eukprot:TRINITY_DN4256_c0_g1_i4.p1 TRINITY_DN4256_c0_g1~~TRINITY_DN4256_c0_g1_i4.p1  ORF type:complete len:123 (-),score=1.61 TRINITY_DN4256_c0_g1_i4:227-595(-)
MYKVDEKKASIVASPHRALALKREQQQQQQIDLECFQDDFLIYNVQLIGYLEYNNISLCLVFFFGILSYNGKINLIKLQQIKVGLFQVTNLSHGLLVGQLQINPKVIRLYMILSIYYQYHTN